MRITTAVICAAGAGTRLLPATKEQPKEMLPLFAPSAEGGMTLKPIVQLIFEQLYDAGIRDFCFVIGRTKRAISDHFTEDRGFLSDLEKTGNKRAIVDLADFYRRLDDSNLTWVNQSRPIGFGHAVLRAKKVVGDSDFLVHAGDTYIVSKAHSHLQRLMRAFLNEGCEAAFLMKEMADVRQRGVAEATKIDKSLFLIQRVVEKPHRAPSNLAIEPVYIFTSCILDYLQRVRPGKAGEIQLTDAIQLLVEAGKKVLAVRLTASDSRLDIGNPENYWEALQESFRASQRPIKAGKS